MPKVTLPFRGINRATDLLTSDNGDATELINARLKDGSIVPAAPIDKVGEMDARGLLGINYFIKKAVWHSKSECYVCVTTEGGMRFYDKDFNRIDGVPSLEIVDDIAVVGNTVCCTTPNGLRFYLWKNNGYVFLGGLPMIDENNVTITTSKVESDETWDKALFKMKTEETGLYGEVHHMVGKLCGPGIVMKNSDAPMDYNLEKSEGEENPTYVEYLEHFDEKVKGYVSESISNIATQKGYIDAAKFRIGFRLFDGSVMSATPEILLYGFSQICDGTDYKGFKDVTDVHVDPGYAMGCNNFEFMFRPGNKLRIRAYGFKADFAFDFSDYFNTEDWEDIITGVEVYTTGSIPFFELSKKNRAGDGMADFEYWRPCVPVPFRWSGVGNWYYIGNGYGQYSAKYSEGGNGNTIVGFVEADGGAWSMMSQSNVDANGEYVEATRFPYGLMYTDAYREKLDNAHIYRLCAKYKLSGEKEWEIDNTSSTELALQEVMVVDGADTNYCGGKLHVYNQRLHRWGGVENLKSRVAMPMSTRAYRDAVGDKQYGFYALADVWVVGRLQGGKTVKRYADRCLKMTYMTGYPDLKGAPSGRFENLLDGLVCYPDSRIDEMVVVIKNSPTVGKPYAVRSFSLKAATTGNTSYYRLKVDDMFPFVKRRDNAAAAVDNGLYIVKPERPEIDNDFDGGYLDKDTIDNSNDDMLNVDGIPTPDGGYGDSMTEVYNYAIYPQIFNDKVENITPKTWDAYATEEEVYAAYPHLVETDGEKRDGLIAVSNAGNPFHFAGKNEVVVGDEEVIGLVANVVSLSQNEFGAQPMYAFTKEGIYALSVDTSGALAYDRAAPVSRDIAENADCISAAGKGVVYVTGGGIRYIEGEDVTQIDGRIIGKEGREIVKSPALYSLCSSLNMKSIAHKGGDIRDYLNGAVAAYNFKEQEVLMSNYKFGFSYIYSIASQSWSKVEGSWRAVVKRGDKTLLLTDQEGANSVWEMKSGERDNASLLYVSRPQSVGTTGYKRCIQMALRGYIEMADGGRMGAYLLGSNDGLHFTLIGGKETQGETRDLTNDSVMSKSYRWLMVAIGGRGIGGGTKLTMAEMDVVTSYETKL